MKFHSGDSPQTIVYQLRPEKLSWYTLLFNITINLNTKDMQHLILTFVFLISLGSSYMVVISSLELVIKGSLQNNVHDYDRTVRFILFLIAVIGWSVIYYYSI